MELLAWWRDRAAKKKARIENLTAIPRFERDAGIVLPPAYRDYAMGCSRGSRLPVPRHLSHIEFIVENWYQPNLPDELVMTGFSLPFDGKTRSWSDMLDGTIVVLNAGCEYYEVLVVSGPDYGAVYGDYDHVFRLADRFEDYAQMDDKQWRKKLDDSMSFKTRGR